MGSNASIIVGPEKRTEIDRNLFPIIILLFFFHVSVFFPFLLASFLPSLRLYFQSFHRFPNLLCNFCQSLEPFLCIISPFSRRRLEFRPNPPVLSSSTAISWYVNYTFDGLLSFLSFLSILEFWGVCLRVSQEASVKSSFLFSFWCLISSPEMGWYGEPFQQQLLIWFLLKGKVNLTLLSPASLLA